MILYHASYVVCPQQGIIVDGGVLVEADQIVASDSLNQLQKLYPQAELVDLGEVIMTPLLVNAHTHLELTDFPDWAVEAEINTDADGFTEWVLELIKVKARRQQSCYEQAIRNGLKLSVAAGTGALGDIISCHKASGGYQDNLLSGLLYLETLGHNQELLATARRDLVEILNGLDLPQIDGALSPHAPYTMSREHMQWSYQFCRQRQLRCSTHIAESPEEVEFIRTGKGKMVDQLYPFVGWEQFKPQGYGISPLQYLYQQGGLFAENLLVHGVQLEDDDIELMARNSMHLALCPRSNMLLKVGKAPAKELYQAGVNLCLGTDSLASNNSLSIWDEMAFAHKWFDGALDAPSLFTMATTGGARALGLEDMTGSLEKGKKAHFQVLKPQTKVASADIFDYFVSPECAQAIDQVYLNGQAQLL